ncbi:hypothetical protein F2Q70_00043681 [Brassica cretica]|uniref:Uncharacterized protein n=1 Tax=Brassica cretica TaxID=69181 RepID=A0A8S9KHE7_BRACR|nr:hypothetical protein F2Q70_00043681 [Brassica cretica]
MAICNIPIPQSELDQSKVGLIRRDRHVGHVIWITRRNLAKEYEGVLIRVKDKFEKKKVEVLAEIRLQEYLTTPFMISIYLRFPMTRPTRLLLLLMGASGSIDDEAETRGIT